MKNFKLETSKNTWTGKKDDSGSWHIKMECNKHTEVCVTLTTPPNTGFTRAMQIIESFESSVSPKL